MRSTAVRGLLKVIQRAATSHLSSDGQVQVFKHCLQALGSAGKAVMERIMAVLGKIFQGDQQACIEVLTTAVDMCQDWESSLASLGATMTHLGAAIAPALQVQLPFWKA